MESVGSEHLHHQVGNLLARLQLALELVDAEVSLSPVQHRLVRSALSTVEELAITIQRELELPPG